MSNEDEKDSYNILSSQRTPSVKFGLGFHETVKGESSSQESAKDSKDINAKPKVLKETKGQPTIMNSQKKSFPPLINNVECFKCHNYGHVAANCRSRLFQSQTKRFYIERYSGSLRDIIFHAASLVIKKLIAIEERIEKHIMIPMLTSLVTQDVMVVTSMDM